MELKAKLHPRNFSGMSGKMAAIVAHIVGKWDDVEITPAGIVEMTVTSDGFVLARAEGDIGFNEFIGPKSELDDNCDRLAKAAELTEEETTEFKRLREEKVRS